jgi:hypothetical protein
VITTALPKPSAQSKLIIGKMEEWEKKHDARWEQVMENTDMLFSQVGDISNHQQKMQEQMNMNTKVVEQMLRDQEVLAKQIQATGQAVARLTLNQAKYQGKQPLSPTSSVTSQEDNPFHTRGQCTRPKSHPQKSAGHNTGHPSTGYQQKKIQVPKLNFPVFDGKHRKIWKDKCENYFQILETPEFMKPVIASMHMDGNVARWLPPMLVLACGLIRC